jgi:ribosomal protein S12 methylthiotransferase
MAAVPPNHPGQSPPPVVGFVSLGCAKNLVDSEKMLGQVAESGAVISIDESAADTIIVNTCGFLEASRAEALDVLRELGLRKRQGTLRRLIVAGCLVQRDGEKLLELVPEIDALVGVNNRDDVAPAVWGAMPSANPIPPRKGAGGGVAAGILGLPVLPRFPAPAQPRDIDLHLGDYYPQPWSDRGRLRLTPRHYAYVRIGEGCSQKCTFCTIPSIRGPLHSKPPDELAAECRELIADGARELILIGQDTTSYGADLGYEPGLAGLLRKLDAECDGARWIRLMYVYPSVFTDAMIDAIADCARVVKYIDIPLQHINDRMLKAMARRVTRAKTEVLLEKLRKRIPGVAIRTTFIVGFPGETQAEFEELLAFVRGFGFDAAGAFKYSFEPETPAARMKNQVDAAVKAERYEQFMLAQQEVALAAARRRIGQTFDVVLDACGDDSRSHARHAGQAPEIDANCWLPHSRHAPGEFVSVRCVGTEGYDLLVRTTRRNGRPHDVQSRSLK